MDVEIKKKDGSTYRLSDYGVVYDFIVGSIELESFSDRLEGRAGMVDYGADYARRTITVPMKFKHETMHEYAHLRDEVYDILVDTDGYYIREMRRPKRLEYEFVDFGKAPKWKLQTDDTYVNGKQYFVRISNTLEPEQLFNGGEIEIEFETVGLPFAKTIYTSGDFDKQGYAAVASKFGLAEGINQNYVKYTFTNDSFNVYNHGQVAIDPRYMELKIVIRGLTTTGNFEVKNNKTGEAFRYTSAATSRTITIDGAIVKDGALNVLRDTNRRFVSIDRGLNAFKVSGGTFTSIEFIFPFYYK
ncbi:phage tail domain-containing protein [Mammaliicoccus sciuri]|uniref:phage tail domain-containing protein n=1 Tax=Mammaliicoccus sciuri TaxID=1296 RepID=UPI0034DCD127